MNSTENAIDIITVRNDLRIEHMYFDGKVTVSNSYQIDGYCLVLCTKGTFNVEMSLQSYEISEGTVIVYTPGNVFKMYSTPDHSQEDIELVTLIASKQFTTGIQLNINKIYNEGSQNSNYPCIKLDNDQTRILKQYFSLMEDISSLGVDCTDTQMSLCSSIFHFMGSILRKDYSDSQSAVLQNFEPNKMRAKEVFDEFLRLVSEYHTQEKGLAFYSDKLCITSKYLSKLVKNVSGRTAPDWINSFVILQAKNLLQYSSMNTKEIAFKLNFKSVPSFYKFFKSQTGLTPMEFKKK